MDEKNYVPVSTFDPKSGELTLRCMDGLVNNFNQTILDCIRCNMDIKFIGSGASAKAILYYIYNIKNLVFFPRDKRQRQEFSGMFFPVQFSWRRKEFTEKVLGECDHVRDLRSAPFLFSRNSFIEI